MLVRFFNLIKLILCLYSVISENSEIMLAHLPRMSVRAYGGI